MYRNALALKKSMTSFLFSVSYYEAEVWLHKHLSFSLKKPTRSVHYRALRVVYGDHPRDEVSKLSMRATPDELSDHTLAKYMIGVARSGNPTRFYSMAIMQSYNECRRPQHKFFYNADHKKIGRQIFSSRLAVIFKTLKFHG